MSQLSCGVIPAVLDSHLFNPNAGVFGPGPIVDWHLNKGGTYNGNTELPVCMTLYSLALANDASMIVETGINHAAGATLWLILASAMNFGHYYGVDIKEKAITEAKKVVGEMFPVGASCSYNLQCGDALEVVPQEFQPGSIDFMFVDDNHGREHVEKEVHAFLPLMRPGGLMCFHDVIGVHEHDIWDVIRPLGAVRVIDTFHRAGHDFGGLGVLKIP